MHVVISYDIVDDKIRTKLHKTLKHFGNPVQKSVFECFLSKTETIKIQQLVAGIIDSKIDQVRYYRLCQNCSKQIETIGFTNLLTNPKIFVL